MRQAFTTPPRPAPKGENVYMRRRRENRYATPATAAKAGPQAGGDTILGLSPGLLLAGLGAAAALAWLATSGDSKATPPKPRHVLGPMVNAKLVFVKSLNGEPLYEKTRNPGGFPDGWGDPDTTITRVANGELVGYQTGSVFQPSAYYPRLIQVYGATATGQTYNAWIQEDQTELMDVGSANLALATGDNQRMAQDSATAINQYFLNR